MRGLKVARQYVPLRIRFAACAGALSLAAVPVAASAHVTVQPGSVEGGGFSVVSFRVPNERDDANTTKVRVLLPANRTLGSVQATPVPGWKITTKHRTLAKPIEMFDSTISTVVSEVTWSATGRGLPVGQFQDFDLSLGVLPESGEMVFKSLQTYSSGEQVNWTQVSEDDEAELEHPAPVLTLVPPDEALGSARPQTEGTSGAPRGGQADADTVLQGSGDAASDSSSVLPLLLSAVALLVSVAGVSLAWTRTRR